MVACRSIQPCLISTNLGECRFLPSTSTRSLQRIFRFSPGSGHVSMQMTKRFSALTDLLINRRNTEESTDSQWKRLKPGKVSPSRPVPSHIPRPPYVNSRKPPGIGKKPQIHDEKGIECMRASGKLAAQVLQYAGTLVKPGITTDEIDQAVHQMIIDNGSYPSPLSYNGFPKSVCTSVNECIAHGIPDSRALEDGDIINIDVTVYLNGYHGDTSATYFVGEVDEDAKNLVHVTKECLHKAISICAPRVEYNKIGKKIHTMQINTSTVLSKNSLATELEEFSTVLQRFFIAYISDQIRWKSEFLRISDFHSWDLQNSLCGTNSFTYIDDKSRFWKKWNNERGRMALNQTFTIEPMLTIGSINPVMWDDNWTFVTDDGSLSAQFEHTLLITKDGAEILTQC
ncbi:Methionine aminopeptidase 1D, chloroplastic/mitochondrial [Castilleja foliolosa]|uniref:Methionine aminopeptidase 1D, chloroplastic/mitochondrial n=1 Tax=Castilleja foliolosa TaxID=1961234 RepID=A0ABD3DVH2_9LAMI